MICLRDLVSIAGMLHCLISRTKQLMHSLAERSKRNFAQQSLDQHHAFFLSPLEQKWHFVAVAPLLLWTISRNTNSPASDSMQGPLCFFEDFCSFSVWFGLDLSLSCFTCAYIEVLFGSLQASTYNLCHINQILAQRLLVIVSNQDNLLFISLCVLPSFQVVSLMGAFRTFPLTHYRHIDYISKHIEKQANLLFQSDGWLITSINPLIYSELHEEFTCW